MAVREAREATPSRVVLLTALAALLAAAALVLALLVGSTEVDPGRLLAFRPTELELRKVVGYRLPRAVAALLVGGALAVSGVIFQALIRNPLASPYVLGVSSGGSLGAVIALALGSSIVAPAAFAGSCAAILLVWSVARSGGRLPSLTLLLAGVVVNAFFSASIMFVNLVAAPRDQDRILRWLIGGLRESYSWAALSESGALILLGAGAAFFLARELNLLSISDLAASRSGVDLSRVRTGLFVCASLLVAIAVSISGPIAFVGLIVPHVLRLLVGPDHRLLLPLALFAGGGFLAAVDALAQSVWRTPLPAGVITAFIGGPLFLVLLSRRDRGRAGLDA